MTTKYGLLKNYDDSIDLDKFREMVAVNAYYRAEKRGFKPGYEIDDWFEAEKDVGTIKLLFDAHQSGIVC